MRIISFRSSIADTVSLHAIYNRNDSANYYFTKAISSAKESGNIRNEFQVYLAESKYLKNLPVKAKTALLSDALRLAEQTHFAEGRAKAAEELSNVYEEQKNRDSSIFFYRMYRTVQDSLFSESNRRNVIVNESEWTIKKKELENSTLKDLTDRTKKADRH